MIAKFCHCGLYLIFFYLHSDLFVRRLFVMAACECVQFIGDGPSSRGVFTSPNYPQIYDTNINCILYTFMGDKDELVQLTFTDFDMELSITNK